jgi:hypothetical protein
MGDILLRHAISRSQLLRSNFCCCPTGKKMCPCPVSCSCCWALVSLNHRKHKKEYIFDVQNLRPEIPRCCPSALANVMKRCWDANPDKRPEMAEVVSMIEAIDTSKGGGMIPVDHSQGCFTCFRQYRGPWRFGLTVSLLPEPDWWSMSLHLNVILITPVNG